MNSNYLLSIVSTFFSSFFDAARVYVSGVAIKNLADLGISTLLFWAVGYSIIFGNSIAGIVGGDASSSRVTIQTPKLSL